MLSLRWATALMLAAALAGGCASTPEKNDKPAPGPVEPSKLAAAKAKYAAIAGALVGEVDDANDLYAAVSGIDGKAITAEDILSFVDVESDEVINHGRMNSVSAAGRLIVKYDPQGSRAPKSGDLVVKLK